MTWTWRRWCAGVPCPLRRNSADHREDDPPFLQTHGDPTNISIKIKQRWNLAIDCQGRHGVDNVDILFTYIISFLMILKTKPWSHERQWVDAANWQRLVPSDRHLYCHVFKYIITAQIACINHYFFVDVGTNLTTRICAAFEFKWDKLETVTCNDLLLVFLRPTDTDAVSAE